MTATDDQRAFLRTTPACAIPGPDPRHSRQAASRLPLAISEKQIAMVTSRMFTPSAFREARSSFFASAMA
jgi:hypothetical protein